VYMTRGNQRDIDRARAAARAKAHAGGSSTLKDAEDHANKLRAKQAAAEERREAERAAAAGDQPATGQSRRAGGEAADADKREALRVAREAAEADLIREQEEARARSGAAAAPATARVLTLPPASKAAPPRPQAGSGAAALAAATNGHALCAQRAESGGSHSGAEDDSSEQRDDAGDQSDLLEAASADSLLEQLADVADGDRAVLEAAVSPRQMPLLTAHQSAPLRFLRAHSGAQLTLHKHPLGDGTLVATGTAPVLQCVAMALRRLLLSPAEGGASEEEYVLTFAPRDARELAESADLSTVPLRYEVQLSSTPAPDGWLELQLHGPPPAVAGAREFVESLLDDSAPLLLDGSAAQRTLEDNGASALSSSTARSHSSASSSASASCEPTVRIGLSRADVAR